MNGSLSKVLLRRPLPYLRRDERGANGGATTRGCRAVEPAASSSSVGATRVRIMRRRCGLGRVSAKGGREAIETETEALFRSVLGSLSKEFPGCEAHRLVEVCPDLLTVQNPEDFGAWKLSMGKLLPRVDLGRMVEQCPKILMIPPAELDERVAGLLEALNFGDAKSMLVKCPTLLLRSEDKISTMLTSLKSYFPDGEIESLLSRCPQLFELGTTALSKPLDRMSVRTIFPRCDAPEAFLIKDERLPKCPVLAVVHTLSQLCILLPAGVVESVVEYQPKLLLLPVGTLAKRIRCVEKALPGCQADAMFERCPDLFLIAEEELSKRAVSLQVCLEEPGRAAELCTIEPQLLKLPAHSYEIKLRAVANNLELNMDSLSRGVEDPRGLALELISRTPRILLHQRWRTSQIVKPPPGL